MLPALRRGEEVRLNRTAVLEERDGALSPSAEDEVPVFHCYSEQDVLDACDLAESWGAESVRVLIHPEPRRPRA